MLFLQSHFIRHAGVNFNDISSHLNKCLSVFCMDFHHIQQFLSGTHCFVPRDNTWEGANILIRVLLSACISLVLPLTNKSSTVNSGTVNCLCTVSVVIYIFSQCQHTKALVANPAKRLSPGLCHGNSFYCHGDGWSQGQSPCPLFWQSPKQLLFPPKHQPVPLPLSHNTTARRVIATAVEWPHCLRHHLFLGQYWPITAPLLLIKTCRQLTTSSRAICPVSVMATYCFPSSAAVIWGPFVCMGRGPLSARKHRGQTTAIV